MMAPLKITIVFLLFATVSFAWKMSPYGKWRKIQTPFFRAPNSNSAGFARPPQQPYADIGSDEDSSEDGLLPLARSWKIFGRLNKCDKCPPGYGLVSMCTATQRTVCKPCTLGITYSALEPHFKPCTPCSKCGDDMYEDISCTLSSDTFCDSCSTKRGFHNEDYLNKCKRDPNAIDKSEFDSTEFDKDLIDDFDFDKFDKPNKIDLTSIPKFKPVLRETEKELDQVSKEDDLDEQLAKVFDDTNQELDQQDEDDDQLDIIKSNVTRFENGIDDSIKVIKPVEWFDFDKNSDEDDTMVGEPESLFRTVLPDDDDKSSEYESFNEKTQIVYKPSDHGYPYQDLLHPDFRYKQIRKVIWLYGITAIMLMMAIMFLTCYAGSYYRRRRAYRMVSVQLTDQDNQIIRECAERLQRTENPSDYKRRNQFVDSHEAGLKIVENPLEDYLDDQAFNGSTESLLPNVHKGQKLQIV